MTNPNCTATESAALPPPETEAVTLVLDAGPKDEVDIFLVEEVVEVSSSSGGDRLISCEVGPAASELPKSVSIAVVGVAVALGAASSRLARVVASAGVENVRVLLSSAKMAEAALASVAVVV